MAKFCSVVTYFVAICHNNVSRHGLFKIREMIFYGLLDDPSHRVVKRVRNVGQIANLFRV